MVRVQPSVLTAAFALAGFLAMSGPLVASGVSQKASQPSMMQPAVTYRAVTFADLPSWEHDDHSAALATFVKSCERVMVATRAGTMLSKAMSGPDVLRACNEAALALGRKPEGKAARHFFETHFIPHRVLHAGTDGLLTGYYEPLFDGSRQRQGIFQAPIYRRPADLVTLVKETDAAPQNQPTHGRKTPTGAPAPYPSRAQIESGALAGHGLELMYLKDSVDVFFMQLQGSGRVKLTDGSVVRVTYDGKNGHAYTSIGRYLADNKIMPADKISLAGLARWLRADPERGRRVMDQNASYVFFREMKGTEAANALGVLQIPLTPGRSLAIDPAFHALGAPVYVSAPTLTHPKKGAAFNRLMVAQDVGGAIKGPERGDIYFGSGDAAGKLAGVTRHPGNLFVLLPGKPTGVLAEAADTTTSTPPTAEASPATPRSQRRAGP
jgi:membrane-bound lytic murein transglycosylase A